MEFLLGRTQELILKFAEHVVLTGVSTFLAIAIGLPLGIWLIDHPSIRGAVMSFVSIVQTIPSLALLAFLLPLFGIGVTPALIALTLYSLLPIVRNTITGIEGVDPRVIEAAHGLGFSSGQTLKLVQLPLAAPVVIAGIRTAAVIAVGIATLAAFIGAGGLGDFITRGLALNSNKLILLGAVPAALFAVVIDYFVGFLERISASEYRREDPKWRLKLGAWGVFIILVGILVLGILWPKASSGGVLRIGSKNFSEQIILGEMLSQLVEAKSDIHVERKLNLGSVKICHDAMLAGELDIYPEYTGTGFRVVLGREEQLSKAEVYKIVKQDYQEKFGMQWLKPFGFDDTYAVIVRQEFAKKNELSEISDLRHVANSIELGFAQEFRERVDGFSGLVENYNLSFSDTREMDLGLLYRALADYKIDVIVANSTDGRIPALDLLVLKDNLSYFPPYSAAPIVRSEAIERFPKLKSILNLLANQISEHEMQELNYRVDERGEKVRDVVRKFLKMKQLA